MGPGTLVGVSGVGMNTMNTGMGGCAPCALSAYAEATPDEPKKSWIACNWPWLVAGAGVIGLGVFLATRD